MEPTGPLLKLTNVTKTYDSPNSDGSLTVLRAISLEVAPGESLAIVGPSGSGKSTLLHIVGTLDHPTTGEVSLNNQNLSRLDEAQLAVVRNQQIGFVFQAHYLLPQCTVLENVLVPTLPLARASRSARDGRDVFPRVPGLAENPDTQPAGSGPVPSRELETPAARAARLLGRVGLADRLSHRPGQLSGGERQRVAVVRALINQPQLLLADEPTGSLDHASAQQLGQLLLELNREERVTLIVVTHSRDLARHMARILELKDGRLLPLHPAT